MAETNVTTVKMEDGRVVDFPGKRKIAKESTVEADGTVTVRLDFVSGATRSLTIPDSIFAKCAAHGAEQKLGDACAGLKDVDDAVIAVEELIARLEAGEWNVRREGNGMAGTSVLARALVESTGKDMATIKEFLSKKSQAEKVALRNNPKIKPIVERIEAEKANKGPQVDTDALLDELGEADSDAGE